jgi:hypothetical protein
MANDRRDRPVLGPTEDSPDGGFNFVVNNDSHPSTRGDVLFGRPTEATDHPVILRVGDPLRDGVEIGGLAGDESHTHLLLTTPAAGQAASFPLVAARAT